MTTIHDLGQYFTTNLELKNRLVGMIKNGPDVILEPSIGRGDLIVSVKEKFPSSIIDMYEIDNSIELLNGIEKSDVIYGDFLKQDITKRYKTIIGNPPYVKTKNGNLHIDFTEKCYDLLENSGELIFIVPSDFLKMTSSVKLLQKMMSNGSFTDIFHPNKEKLFSNASVDIIVFRYCKNNLLDKIVNYNNEMKHISCKNGLISFSIEKQNDTTQIISDYFDVYVGQVSGNEKIMKNMEFGNIDILNGENIVDKYIKLDIYPTENEKLNEYLIQHKEELINRGIRKFTEKNWYEFGSLRNVRIVDNHIGKDCIYVKNLTRHKNIAFKGIVSYFGGGILMLYPKKNVILENVVDYLNSDGFKENFLFSGRFMIGQRQISNSYIHECAYSK
jgi:adenine-specific DNA-methyltransferase